MMKSKRILALVEEAGPFSGFANGRGVRKVSGQAGLALALRRLCELAFVPSDELHVLASRVMADWASARTGSESAPADAETARAIGLYLQLCQRDRRGAATGALDPAEVALLKRASGAGCNVGFARAERRPA